METTPQSSGSATRWGPLFGAQAQAWAQTWEGPTGWGTEIYGYVLDRGQVRPGSRVLDCGCGAGRFARMTADVGAAVAGIDAAPQLVKIAAARTAAGDFRVGDLESLPWPDDSFDVVTGFSAFQFADDKAQALSEARRVSRGLVAVVVPDRVPESGIAAVFKPLFPLFPPEALTTMKHSGMFALSERERLDDTLDLAGLRVHEDVQIDSPVRFDDTSTAVRAFVGAGPMQLAVERSGEQAVADAARDALASFTAADGRIVLPASWRVVLARRSLAH